MDRRRWPRLAGIVLVALGLRLVYVLWVGPQPVLEGGDALLYLDVATNMATGYGFKAGDDYQSYRVPITTVGPLYPYYLALFLRPESALKPIVAGISMDANLPNDVRADLAAERRVIWDRAAFRARLGQALISALTVICGYGVAHMLFSEKAALMAAGLLALDLRLIIESSSVYTETIYIFFLLAGLWAYLRAVESDSLWGYVGALALFGGAALTRPVAALIPALLLLHQFFRHSLHEAVGRAVVVTATVALVFVPWVVRNYVVTGRLIPLADGAFGHLWLGALGEGEWRGFDAFNEQLAQLRDSSPGADTDEAFSQAALRAIAADPPGYVWLVARKVGRAYLQPASTAGLGDQSVKALFVDFLKGQVPLTDVVGASDFLPKLWVLIWHFGGLGWGAAGMWLSRREWRRTFPLIALIVYTTGVHALLTIIPRYVLPIMPLFVIFAASAIHQAWERRWVRRPIGVPAPAAR